MQTPNENSPASDVRHRVVMVAALTAVLLYLDRFCILFAEIFIQEDPCSPRWRCRPKPSSFSQRNAAILICAIAFAISGISVLGIDATSTICPDEEYQPAISFLAEKTTPKDYQRTKIMVQRRISEK